MKRKLIVYIIIWLQLSHMMCFNSLGQTSLTIQLLPGEKVWSATMKEAQKMPFATGYKFDFYANNQYNQIQPLLLGNKGLWVWSEKPFTFEIQEGKTVISNAYNVQKLISHLLNEGLIGYTFSCPDMIGGGEYNSFTGNPEMDQELIVRSAQIHALMPMMQFSVAPWRILDKQHLDAVKKAVEVRKKFTSEIMELAAKSAKTGDPVVSSMEYIFPNQGFENVSDQFMLGTSVLVAPVTEKDKKQRNVVLPGGKWLADDGKTYKGGKSYNIDVPIDRIPYFTILENEICSTLSDCTGK